MTPVARGGDDCARARLLLRQLDAASPIAEAALARARAGAGDLAEPDADWLARHLESCAACSGAGDRSTSDVLDAVADLFAPPDDAFFATRHAEIMSAVRAEPADGPADRATRRSARLGTYGLALAASLLLAVAVVELAPRLGGLGGGREVGEPVAFVETDYTLAALSEPEALALARAEDDLLAPRDAWLLASTEAPGLGGDVDLEGLSDDELDDLAAALGAEQG